VAVAGDDVVVLELLELLEVEPQPTRVIVDIQYSVSIASV
jgi:hypothetical protein